MSTQPNPRPSVDVQVSRQDDIVLVVHQLGGDVDVEAFDEDGKPAKFGAAIPISENEVAVHVVPGQVYNLRITLADPDDATSH